jgi:hypothetical protein
MPLTTIECKFTINQPAGKATARSERRGGEMEHTCQDDSSHWAGGGLLSGRGPAILSLAYVIWMKLISGRARASQHWGGRKNNNDNFDKKFIRTLVGDWREY